MTKPDEALHRFAFAGNAIVDSGDLQIAAVSDAALYGKGIFTTAAIYSGRPFLWEKHWRRLVANAGKLGIDLSDFCEDSVLAALMALIEKNSITAGRARVSFFDESSAGMWKTKSKKTTKLLILTQAPRSNLPSPKLTVSPFRINTASPLAGTKSINYLENLLSLDEARKRGFDEAIRVNENGHAASACLANILWLKNGKLFTPSLRTGCLPGTTREFVLENLSCSEVEEKLDEIRQADEIFLTSAGIGVVQVSEFDGRKLPDRSHKILTLIAAALESAS